MFLKKGNKCKLTKIFKALLHVLHENFLFAFLPQNLVNLCPVANLYVQCFFLSQFSWCWLARHLARGIRASMSKQLDTISDISQQAVHFDRFLVTFILIY